MPGTSWDGWRVPDGCSFSSAVRYGSCGNDSSTRNRGAGSLEVQGVESGRRTRNGRLDRKRHDAPAVQILPAELRWRGVRGGEFNGNASVTARSSALRCGDSRGAVISWFRYQKGAVTSRPSISKTLTKP